MHSLFGLDSISILHLFYTSGVALGSQWAFHTWKPYLFEFHLFSWTFWYTTWHCLDKLEFSGFRYWLYPCGVGNGRKFSLPVPLISGAVVFMKAHHYMKRLWKFHTFGHLISIQTLSNFTIMGSSNHSITNGGSRHLARGAALCGVFRNSDRREQFNMFPSITCLFLCWREPIP